MNNFSVSEKSKRRSRRRNGKKDSEDVENKEGISTEKSAYSLGTIVESSKGTSTERAEPVKTAPSHVLMVNTENITHEPFESSDEIKVNFSFACQMLHMSGSRNIFYF